MKPGPELDERVGRLLGIEPELFWGAGRRAENSWMFSGNEWQCRDWFARHQKEYPEHAAGMEVYSVEWWPKFSADGNAMLRAIDAMRERGHLLFLKSDGLRTGNNPGYTVLIDSLPRVDSASLPHAVALAICEALEATDA